MKIVFINPPFKPNFSRGERSPQVSLSGTLYYPVWLAQAAAFVEKHGAEIALLDAVADRLTDEECISWIGDCNPRCLVLETSTPSWHRDKLFTDLVRGKFPDLFIVIVGTHVSALPEECLQENRAADAVIRGEYEPPLAKLKQALENGGNLAAVDGLSYRDTKGIHHNPAAPFLEDLDEIPFVSSIYKRFLNHRNYFFAAANYPGIMLMTGRGCPNRCMWCLFNQTLHGRKYRFRSPGKIIDEFEYIIESYPDLKEIWIDDDTFTANKAHVREVCRLIIQKNLFFKHHPFRWYCNARPPLDLDTMRLMKQAGCRLVVTGFESGDSAILRSMHKGFDTGRAIKFMQDARQAGLLVHGCFEVGNPGETVVTMNKTLEFSCKLRPDSAQFYFIHPYPGTEYYAWAKENGYLATDDFALWLHEDGRHRCVLNLPGLSADCLEDFCNRAYKKYHFSLPYLLMKTKQLAFHPAEGLRSIRSGISFVKKLMVG